VDNVISANPGTEQNVYVINNPFENSIQVRLAQQPKSKVSLSLFDMSGKLLVAKEFRNAGTYLELNTSFIQSKSIYILKTDVDGIIFTNKLVKD
jgi:hypothetical protein